MTKCIAEPISRKDIRKMAERIRIIERSNGKYFFDIIHFLEVTLPKIDPSFTFSVKPISEMCDCHGLTYPDRNEIQIREDVYERACGGNGRDRLTMAHELFHLLHHGKESISYARSNNTEIYRDPEWQADAFGGELLIPHDLIIGMTPQQVVVECQVSLAAAKCQLRKR